MTAALHPVPPLEPLAPSLEGYRVLARKYRPTKLSQIIGQDFLVETLKRGIEGERLGHAFILTGIRGTGKTTIARIIARALNCLEGPTPEPCDVCTSCIAISQDRSLDVIEIDAASRTSVEDIREIIEASRYKAVSARYKIYIIDEVHMLSKSAFNALLKTLEEPPLHVKFIFATTEIHKVPATILSRCVRFDLNRIESSLLATYFKTLCEQENVTYEEEALALIAKAAEGSARDGLSLLDQAISYGTSAKGVSHVAPSPVRKMLGLSDQSALLELFHILMEGNSLLSLEKLRYFYQEGADPLRMVEELLDLTHWLQCLKINPSLTQDITITPEKQQKGAELANSLSIPTLMRTWHILLKGFEEIKKAPSPQKTLEVMAIRLTHLAPLPPLQELLDELSEKSSVKKKS
jgi:DNA polymerase-3 subunit gamma/tau